MSVGRADPRRHGKWKEAHGAIDVLVHAVAYAKREDLEGAFADTSRDGSRSRWTSRRYSLVALVREARAGLLRPRLA